MMESDVRCGHRTKLRPQTKTTKPRNKHFLQWRYILERIKTAVRSTKQDPLFSSHSVVLIPFSSMFLTLRPLLVDVVSVPSLFLFLFFSLSRPTRGAGASGGTGGARRAAERSAQRDRAKGRVSGPSMRLRRSSDVSRIWHRWRKQHSNIRKESERH